MRIFLIFLAFVIIGTFLIYPEVKNNDTPLKGELNFKLGKIWEIEAPGDAVFARIRQMEAAEDGTLYIYDNKNPRYYIFDKNGKFINAFGEKGEGPGEIRKIIQAPIFLADDKIVIKDISMLHFFGHHGKFIKSIFNDSNQRPPNYFLNANVFVSAPRTLLGKATGKTGHIRLINLKNDQVKILFDFSLIEGAVIKTREIQTALVHEALTPMMTIGHSQDYKHLYFGVSDIFKITISDMKGKIINTFRLKREKRQISEKMKKEGVFKRAKGRAPVEVLEQLAKKLPTDLTYFNRIEEHNGLIYIFTPYWIRKNIQQIDIFSPQGNYLYRAFIKVETNNIAALPIIKKGFLWLALEDEEGELSIAKYNITLPQ